MDTILVTGATGAQGGATVDALLARRMSVRALVRDGGSEAARVLAARGVQIAVGDFDDRASMEAAVAGVGGVFSVQLPAPPHDPEAEVRAGRYLVEAAQAAGVSRFVHTSVARADEHEAFVGWKEDRWSRGYWESKAAVNDLVRAAGFPHWTILKPAFMMDNFVDPKVRWMFPGLTDGVIETAMLADRPLHLIAAADIGLFAGSALAHPAAFDGRDIPLAAEALTMAEVAAAITLRTGRTVVARSLDGERMVGRGVSPGLVSSQQWANVEGYDVDIPALARFGLPLMSFAHWLRVHGGRLPEAATAG